MSKSSALDFAVGFHLGVRYAPGVLGPFLRVIERWISNDVTVYWKDSPIEQVTFAHLANSPIPIPDPRSYRINDTQMQIMLSSGFVQSIEAKLRNNGRIIRMSPWLHEDDTMTIELAFPLKEGEETEPIYRLVKKTCGEELLMSLLGRLDFLWAALAVDPFFVSLGDVRMGRETLPTICACYGPNVVREAGREKVLSALAACPKIIELDNGGIFFCWVWESSRPIEGKNFKTFVTFASSIMLERGVIATNQGDTSDLFGGIGGSRSEKK